MTKRSYRAVAAVLSLAFLAGSNNVCEAGSQEPSNIEAGSHNKDSHNDEFGACRVRCNKELIKRLERHASWCRGRKVFGEYAKTLRLILEVDPQNKTALKGLGYKKRGGEWLPPKVEKTFNNRNEKALAEVPERLEQAIRPLVDCKERWVREGELNKDDRCLALADILRVDPSNAFVAKAGVDVRAAAAQVLPETVVAKDRREALKALVVEGFKNAPESFEGELLDADEALGVEWLGVVESPSMRVVYATTFEEADRLLHALHATESLFRELFPKRRGLPMGLTVYLMETETQKALFLENHPRVTDKNRDYLAQLGGSGIQGSNDFAFWSGDEQRRADGIVRIALGWMFIGGFGFSVETGWAYEGLGLYLTRALVRTRLNWTAQADPSVTPTEDFKLRTRLLLAETNWMEEARLMWTAGRAPDLEELLRKNVNELSTEDILASYVLAAYLLEGQPEKADHFLRLSGTKMPIKEQIERAFGWDPETLCERAGRWLSERR